MVWGTNQSRRWCLRAAAGVSGLIGVGAASATSGTVRVPEDYDTIQAAVDAVASGGRVEVGPGVYEEQVNVGKPVTVVGDPGDDDPGVGSDAPVLDGGGQNKAVGFNLYQSGSSPDDVTIRGFEIRNYGPDSFDDGWGKGVSGGVDNTGITITDCTFRDITGPAVTVSSPGDRTYSDWTVERIRTEGPALAGVRFDHVSDAVIRDSEFRGDTGSGPTPKSGVHIHTSTRQGNSSTQEDITIEGNQFRGDFEWGGVFLLAINKNDPDTSPDTLARMRRVEVVDNEFAAMPETKAVNVGVNPGQGAPTQLRDLTVRNNSIDDAGLGVSLGSGWRNGIDDVVVADNEIAGCTRGLNLGVNDVGGGTEPAIDDVRSTDNVFRDVDVGMGLWINDDPETAGDYVVGKLTSDGDTFRNGGGTTAFGVGRPTGVRAIELRDLTVESGNKGVIVGGGAPDAIGSVTLADLDVEVAEIGLRVAGHATDAIGEFVADGLTARADGFFTVWVDGQASNAIGSAAFDELDVRDGTVGLFCVGSESDGLGSISVRNSEIRDNDYGVVVCGKQDGDAVTIRQTNFVGNEKEDDDSHGFGVINCGPNGEVDARENYWGSPSGPATPRPGVDPREYDPDGDQQDQIEKHYPKEAEFVGQGDKVSKGVLYDPWLRGPA